MTQFPDDKYQTVYSVLRKATSAELEAGVGLLTWYNDNIQQLRREVSRLIRFEKEYARLSDKLRSAEAKADMMTKRAHSKDNRRKNAVGASGRLRKRREKLLKENEELRQRNDEHTRENERLRELIAHFGMK